VLSYENYAIQATTAYGPNKRPVLYNVDQPLYAVPKQGSGIGRNYSFGIFCTIPAYYNVNVTTNTTDDGHGDHGGSVVEPKDHVEAKLGGLRADGSSILGDRLTYTVHLKDNTYASLIPVTCKYFNPSNEVQNIPFVLNSCPQPFPDDPDGYFSNIQRSSNMGYDLNFRAFSFDTAANSMLGIACDILLCIDKNKGDCNLPCWGGPTGAPTSSAASTSTGETSTSGATTSEATTSEATTSEATTSEATTSASSTTEETTSASSSTEATPGPKRNRRFVLRFEPGVNMNQATLKDQNDPVSVTINEKNSFPVKLPGSETDSHAICENSVLLTALYGIIGGLGLLTVILLITLVYLLCIGRRHKVEHEMYPMVPEGPRQY